MNNNHKIKNRSCFSSNKQLKPAGARAQEAVWRLVRRHRDAWIALVQHMDPWLDWDLGSLETGSTCQSLCSHHRAVAEHFVSCGGHPFWRREVFAIGEQCGHRRCASSAAIFTWSGSHFSDSSINPEIFLKLSFLQYRSCTVRFRVFSTNY